MKEFHSSIFFTKVPLGGHYRYSDFFQIFPVDSEKMPYFKYQNHYPNILEYWTTDDDKIEMSIENEEFKEYTDLKSRTATTLLKQDKILNLLSAFTNNLFFRYYDHSGFWGIPRLKDNALEESNESSSKWCVKIYNSPDMPRYLYIKDFSEQTSPEIKRISNKEFYTKNPNLDYDSNIEIVLPSTIDVLFDTYYSLAPEISKAIDTAALYAVSAIELKSNRKTLSLVASFLAMETMINLEYRDYKPEKCLECGQLRFSIARKFREYLLKYIGDTANNKKKFNDYYSLRSKIIHTGEHLKTELLFNDLPRCVKEEEYLTRLEILQMGKLAITNWLLKNQ